jgi:hypothetical protein
MRDVFGVRYRPQKMGKLITMAWLVKHNDRRLCFERQTPGLGASLDTNAAQILTIYDNPGSNYAWASITNLQFTNWQLQGSTS